MDGQDRDATGVEYYRLRAQMARQLGENATTEAGKLWLKIADRYDVIVDELEAALRKIATGSSKRKTKSER
jgi:hypothetical protein